MSPGAAGKPKGGKRKRGKPEGPTNGQSGGDAAELEKLRRENADLKARQAKKEGNGTTPEGGGASSAGRSLITWSLIVLTCLAVLFAVLATWTHWTVLNTNRFVDTVAPLIKEDAVAQAVSQETVKRLFSQLDVKAKIEKELEKGLPNSLDFAAKPAAQGAEQLAEFLTVQIIKSNAFQTVWRNVLAVAHSEAVKGVRAGGPVEIKQNGQVVLDVTELLTELRDKMVAVGLGFMKNVKVPKDLGTIVLYKNSQLGNVKTAVNTLDILFWILPWAAVLLLLASVLIAWNRRSALIGIAIGVIIAMVAVLLVLAIVKPHYLDQIKNGVDRHAAIVAASKVQRGLNTIDVGLMIISALTIIAAVVAGPYGWSRKLHGAVSIPEHRKSTKGEAAAANAGVFTRYAWLLRAAGLAAAILLLLYLPQASAAVVVAVCIIYVLYLAGIEVLR